MKNLIENRRKESNLARTAEFYSRTDFMLLQHILTKAFNSGVSAQRDYQEAQRQEAMDKARELYNAQRDTEPVAVMDVDPGEMIASITIAGSMTWELATQDSGSPTKQNG